MNDLEEEFKKLVDGMYREIASKEASGEIDRWDAQALRDMVYNRVANVEGKEDDSWCASSSYDDDGWRSSSSNC